MKDLIDLNHKLMAEVQLLRRILGQMLFADEISMVEPVEAEGADGVPVPAAFLRYLVAGTEDLQWFLDGGKLGVKALECALAGQGRSLEGFSRILDFGCGCGRVLRHLRGLKKAEINGTDSNPMAVRWCAKHLDFAQFTVNSLEPPLPFPDHAFDLVYAFSVFTHLTEPLQGRWMSELRRILVPGGYLIVSVHGTRCADELSPSERARFDSGELVVREPGVVGTNYCMAFHPESYVRRVLARDFEVVEFLREGAKGNPPQDLYLIRPQACLARLGER